MNQQPTPVLQPKFESDQGDHTDDYDCEFHVFNLPSDCLYAPPHTPVAIPLKNIVFAQPKHSVSSINAVADEDIQRMLLERRPAPAFELLVDRYHQKVFRLAYSIMGDSASADDVTQD